MPAFGLAGLLSNLKAERRAGFPARRSVHLCCSFYKGSRYITKWRWGSFGLAGAGCCFWIPVVLSKKRTEGFTPSVHALHWLLLSFFFFCIVVFMGAEAGSVVVLIATEM
ncbi:MAG: hypothetical protein ACOY9J_11435 [Pseudomonadota bacterium]